MEGLLLLLLLGWIFSNLKKKNKTASSETVLAKGARESAAKRRAEHAMQLREERERRRMQQTVQAQPVQRVPSEQPVIGEGESYADSGSMRYDSTEGECVCEPELEHRREAVREPESVYEGEIGREPIVDFSAKGILQGVVMSEILTRPSQRKRRR